MAPLITVGIPTYNGAARISKALDSVINQIAPEHLGKIDILISDNASQDSLEAVVQSYQSSSPVPVYYTRNHENLGYDRNVINLFNNAKGEFVWLLADDDSLKPGALDRVLRVLQSHPDLLAVMVNFDKFNHSFSELVDSVNIPADLLCKDASTFLLNAKSRYNLISSLIISRAAWNREDIGTGIGCNFIHVYALMRLLLRGSAYIIGQPLVNAREGSKNFGTSGDSLLSIALSASTILHDMREIGHNKKLVNKLLAEARSYTLHTIPPAKLAGIKHPWLVARKLVAIHNSPELWLKWLPVLFIPNVLFRQLYFAKKSVSARTKFIERSLKRVFKCNRSAGRHDC